MSEPTAQSAPPRQPLSGRKRLLFALAPLAVLLLVGEVAVRVWRGALLDPADPREARIRLFQTAYPAVPDPRLGYVPRPGASVNNARWRAQVTIDAAGLRSNGPQAAPPGPPILAVGDSFTFGDEVADAESWPAQLEDRLGRRVLNGGVFGYGLDQIVLRAEALLAGGLKPAALVVGLIADDVNRCEYSYRFAPKPYFALADGELKLENVPVPERLPAKRLRCFSHLLDAVMLRAAYRWWHSSQTTRAHGDGVQVARLLMRRLKRLGETRELPILILTLGKPVDADAPRIEPVVAAAGELGLPVLDLRRAQRDLSPAARDPLYAGYHMNAAGNAWVAKRVAAQLAARWPRLAPRR